MAKKAVDDVVNVEGAPEMGEKGAGVELFMVADFGVAKKVEKHKEDMESSALRVGNFEFLDQIAEVLEASRLGIMLWVERRGRGGLRDGGEGELSLVGERAG